MTLLIKNFTKQKLNQKYLNKIAEKTLEIAKFKKPAEISLVVTGNQRIRTLNKKYRGKDKITDTLSFSALENKLVGSIVPLGLWNRNANRGSAFGLHRADATMEPANFAAAKKIKFISPKEKAFLGEIFICHPRAARQAKIQKHSAEKEIAILLIHSVLHLLGYTHHKKSEMIKMKQKEKAVYSFCLREN